MSEKVSFQLRGARVTQEAVAGPIGPAVIAAAIFVVLAIVRWIVGVVLKRAYTFPIDVGLIAMAIIVILCLIGGLVAIGQSSDGYSPRLACPTTPHTLQQLQQTSNC